MKFLVLALCVCAASAASIVPNKPFAYSNSYPKFGAQAFAQVGSGAVGRVSRPVPVVSVPVDTVQVAPVPVVPATKNYVNTFASVPVVGKNYVNSEVNAETLRQVSEVRPDGYEYTYETSNGIAAQSSGALKRVGDVDSVVVQGSYKYTSPEGVPVVITYVADENGYQPQGDHLPVAPPVPEAIARSLAYIAAQPKYVDAKQY